jgi:hypothetical protein
MCQGPSIKKSPSESPHGRGDRAPALQSKGQWFNPWSRQPEKLLICVKTHGLTQTI